MVSEDRIDWRDAKAAERRRDWETIFAPRTPDEAPWATIRVKFPAGASISGG